MGNQLVIKPVEVFVLIVELVVVVVVEMVISGGKTLQVTTSGCKSLLPASPEN